MRSRGSRHLRYSKAGAFSAELLRVALDKFILATEVETSTKKQNSARPHQGPDEKTHQEEALLHARRPDRRRAAREHNKRPVLCGFFYERVFGRNTSARNSLANACHSLRRRCGAAEATISVFGALAAWQATPAGCGVATDLRICAVVLVRGRGVSDRRVHATLLVECQGVCVYPALPA
eukprot:CAMPEP_0115220920 /NCGR_PEP_ID=MMETSP0270-20121206/27698_1 /TAXON_ID=71861 /ORGANISM="Scrippsiella trochoidea, Strain CCMP3099" /LENGTH=178 /DNA_ID=CAMNT_0002634995 /DNA_START=382 /DNA_END=918 /DNA_ORIENTATION=+